MYILFPTSEVVERVRGATVVPMSQTKPLSQLRLQPLRWCQNLYDGVRTSIGLVSGVGFGIPFYGSPETSSLNGRVFVHMGSLFRWFSPLRTFLDPYPSLHEISLEVRSQNSCLKCCLCLPESRFSFFLAPSSIVIFPSS